MFRAIRKLFSAFFYLITGRIDEARKTLMENPNVIKANYDEIVREKQNRLSTYEAAVTGLITQQEEKMNKLKLLSSSVEQKENLKAGAAAKAKTILAKYDNPETVKKDADYLKCQAAYRNFAAELEEKRKSADELDYDIHQLGTSIESHKNAIASLSREINNLKEEKNIAVAEIISAKEEKNIADMLRGISEDKTAQELQELRNIRSHARAAARTSRELAGIDVKQSETEFLEYAHNSEADNEFEKLIGLTSEVKMLENQPNITVKIVERTKEAS